MTFVRKDDKVRYKVWYKSEMNLEMNEIYQESPSPLNDQLLPKFKLSMRQHRHSSVTSVVKVGMDRAIIHWGQMACGCLFERDHGRLRGWECVFCFSAGGPLLTITTSTVFASLGKPLYVSLYNTLTVNFMPSLPMHFCTIGAINKACSTLQVTMCTCIFACHLFWINSCRTPASIVIDPNAIKQIFVLDYVCMPEN